MRHDHISSFSDWESRTDSRYGRKKETLREDCASSGLCRREVHTSPFNLTFSSSCTPFNHPSYQTATTVRLTLYGAYHFANRVFPLWRYVSQRYATRRFHSHGDASQNVLAILDENEGEHHHSYAPRESSVQ